ncbi:hypothetical protein COCMIDRAFT_86492 [Bipolaris oryzae ATCC 44560]|uniref:Uncharacterized protein n=1 Tax=Bipolaris oryzae ATCC 44560 TaxID=930090 RepID=W6ZFI8_COCMI|nr:uncharacterized protein COCMIDRAFT_86492 [Bipolaris oryzae ATCC 44560]EUC48780.1 hypothetical protein COCMIDRAFT_86492 [Bipolaris oryzae ATCC 44560]
MSINPLIQNTCAPCTLDVAATSSRRLHADWLLGIKRRLAACNLYNMYSRHECCPPGPATYPATSCHILPHTPARTLYQTTQPRVKFPFSIRIPSVCK